MAAASGKQVKAGEAFVEVSAKTSGVKKVFQALGKDLKKLGQNIFTAGGGLAAAGSAMLAPLLGLSTAAISTGSDIADMAARLNTSTEAVQGFAYAASLAGGSIEDVEKSLAKMQQSIASGDTIIGVDTNQLLGMDMVDQVKVFADAIAAIEDPAQQTAAALDIFGKSGRKMLPFLRQGSAGIDKMFARARKIGILSKGDVDTLDRAGDALGEIWMVVKSVGLAIGTAFVGPADSLESFTDQIIDIGIAVRKFIQDNAALIQTIGAVAVGLIAAGSALMALGVAIASAGAALTGLVTVGGAIASAFAFILSPLGLITVGLAALAVGIGVAIAKSQTFTEILGDFESAFGGILDALKGGDLALAAEIGFAAVSIAWQRVLNEMTAAWRNFNEALTFDPKKSKTAGNFAVARELKPSEFFKLMFGYDVPLRPEVDDKLREQNANDRQIDANRAERDKNLEAELEKKKKVIEDLNEAAMFARFAKEDAEALRAMQERQLLGGSKRLAAAAVAANEIKGAFASELSGRSLAFGSNSVEKHIADTAANTGEMKGLLQKLNIGFSD